MPSATSSHFTPSASNHISRQSLSCVGSIQDHEQQEPGKPQADRAEVFGMKIKVVRDGDAVRATEGGDQVGIYDFPPVLNCLLLLNIHRAECVSSPQQRCCQRLPATTLIDAGYLPSLPYVIVRACKCIHDSHLHAVKLSWRRAHW